MNSHYSSGSGRRAGVVAVKMPAVVRLSKSRSVGGVVSRTSRLVLEFEGDPLGRRRGGDLSNDDDNNKDKNKKLVISLDEKSDKEMLEKPLVSISD